jgi:hypothetical protein
VAGTWSGVIACHLEREGRDPLPQEQQDADLDLTVELVFGLRLCTLGAEHAAKLAVTGVGGVMDTTKLTVRQGEIGKIHPEVEKISGLIPADVDARAEYREHILEKYRRAKPLPS